MAAASRLPAGEGVGVAVGVLAGRSTSRPRRSAALDPDGTLTVVTGVVDMTGDHDGFATIAAAAFGVARRSRVVNARTRRPAPYRRRRAAASVTYSVGTRVAGAPPSAAKAKLLRFAAEQLEIDAGDLEIVDGRSARRARPDRPDLDRGLASSARGFGGSNEPIEGHGGSAQTSPAPSCRGHLAHVRVDRETGEVELLRYAIAQDVGRALNPALVEGQMRGGAAQASAGRSTKSSLRRRGRPAAQLARSWTTPCPNAERVPPIETLIVEVPAPDGPFGAKGIGEAPVVRCPAAIANAVAAATGVRLRELPMTPPRIWAALQEG